MGVPKFFRYISERYPCLSEVVKEYQIPEFDNLYLDMNGIIHVCSHPDDGDPHFRITEEKIFTDIFHYIEVLFRMIKPRKLFFMAVDGVAPRAKMNQQRGRRFRSAKEATVLESKARDRGEVLPTEARFDSNCITPGTVFMVRLHEQLKYFVANKISTDKLWRDCKIILSGHKTPGEGEHKIMDYIRYMRAQPGYDPNTRHCLYGLDADLIMLGLCTHEPHFSLLREEVRFGKKANRRKNVPEQMTFFLLHLSLMREYLELEFYDLKDSLTFDYDIEKIIDDWVLMGFLVGNDFIPHLPNMHITNAALPILYKAYIKVLPTLGGYINEGGILNLKRFESFICELSSIDLEHFTEKYADLKWFEAKTGRSLNENFKSKIKMTNLDISDWISNDVNDIITNENLEKDIFKKVPSTMDICHQEDEISLNPELAVLIKETNNLLLDVPEDDKGINECDERDDLQGDINLLTDEDALFKAEFLQHKSSYYINKLEFEDVTEEVLKSQTEEYIRAIQWNLHYYYNGICSWSWFYPHHYAPYVSDIKDFSHLTLNFELAKPFKPYEQLLAVLPAASKSLLPLAYQGLMTSDSSPIKQYYPENFKTDLNGKRQDWEAVVLIPFIDENTLIKAMESCSDKLTLEERSRNCHGPMLVYRYTEEDLGEYEAPEYFPPIKQLKASCLHLSTDEIQVPREKLVKGAYPGANFDVHYLGFPTMKHLKYKGTLENASVKVFEHPSRGDNMILNIITDEEEILPDSVAKKILGKIVHVGWPHLMEALVVSVSNKNYRYQGTGEIGQYNVEENKNNIGEIWNIEKNAATEHFKTRLGINVGETEILIHVKLLTGQKYTFTPSGHVSLIKQWASITKAYPYQTIIQNLKTYENDCNIYKDIQNIFPIGSSCFMLGGQCYGATVKILESKVKNGRLKVCLKQQEEPDLSAAININNKLRANFVNVHVAATKIGISKNLLSRLTGCVLVLPSKSVVEDVPKINIGLNIKYNKKNEEVPGYTRKENTSWLYSGKAIALIKSYNQAFPDVVEYLNEHSGADMFFEDELFPTGNAKDRLKEIVTWIKQQSFYSIERQVCGSLTVDSEAVQLLEMIVDDFQKKVLKKKQFFSQVRPHVLYKHDLQMGNLMPDPAAKFQLFDRVVNVREGYTVPMGFKGTIIGIYKSQSGKDCDTTFDVMFDEVFVGGLSIHGIQNRVYRMPSPAIINISHGLRLLQHGDKHTNLQDLSLGALKEKYSLSNNFVPAETTNVSNEQVQVQPQPPIFRNWFHGCSFQMQPPLSSPTMPVMHNFNLYDYGPNFNSYPQHVPHGSPNYKGPYRAPQPFNLHEANHFPLSRPIVPPQNLTPSSKVSNVNWSKTPNNVVGGTPIYSAQSRNTELKESKHTLNPKQFMFAGQVNAMLNHDIVQKSRNQQYSQHDSDILKKMLKINDNSNDSKMCNDQEKSKCTKENVTKLTVDNLSVHNNDDKISVSKPPLNAVPEPPKQWHGIPKSNYNTQKNNFQPPISLQQGNKIIQKTVNVKVEQDQIFKHLNLKPSKTNNYDSKTEFDDKSVSSPSFIPLQAVRQYRNKTFSLITTNEECRKDKSLPRSSTCNENTTGSTNSQINVPTKSTETKPRRERTIRIAANFSTAMNNTNLVDATQHFIHISNR